MDKLELKLYGDWSARELAECLSALERLYQIFATVEAVDAELAAKEKTGDTLIWMAANARITDISSRLYAGTTPDNSKAIVPYKPLEIEKIEHDSKARKPGSLIVRGREKVMNGLKWALEFLNTLAGMDEKQREEQLYKEKIKGVEDLRALLEKLDLSKEQKNEIIMATLDEKGVLPQRMKENRLALPAPDKKDGDKRTD